MTRPYKSPQARLLEISVAADSRTRYPRKRLAEIRRMADLEPKDALQVAVMILAQCAKEDRAVIQTPLWRKATRNAAKLAARRRKVAERAKKIEMEVAKK